MGQRFVLHLYGASAVGGRRFIHRGHHYDVVARPMDFRSWPLHHMYALDSGKLLRRRGVYAHDFGMSVRAADHLAVEHSWPVDVVGVLGASGNLVGAIDARDAFADERSFFWRGPIIVRLVVCHTQAPFVALAACMTAARIPA